MSPGGSTIYKKAAHRGDNSITCSEAQWPKGCACARLTTLYTGVNVVASHIGITNLEKSNIACNECQN